MGVTKVVNQILRALRKEERAWIRISRENKEDSIYQGGAMGVGCAIQIVKDVMKKRRLNANG